MAAPLWPLPPEQWALPQEERWRLWEEMTGETRPGDICIWCHHEDEEV
jgi:hypothetical protein